MFNSAVVVQGIHMLLAAYVTSGFLVAGVYAWAWMGGRRQRIVDGEAVDAIEIPYLASLIAERDPNAVIPGLDSVPAVDRMSGRLATMVHWSFQIMVGIGTGLLALAAWFGFCWWRRREPPSSRLFWVAAAFSGEAAAVAMEAGWIDRRIRRCRRTGTSSARLPAPAGPRRQARRGRSGDRGIDRGADGAPREFARR